MPTEPLPEAAAPVNPPFPTAQAKGISARRELSSEDAQDCSTWFILAGPVPPGTASWLAAPRQGARCSRRLHRSHQRRDPECSCNLYGSFHYFPSPKTCSINYQFMNSKVLCAALNKREGEKNRAQPSSNGRAFHPGKKAITAMMSPFPQVDNAAFMSWRVATPPLSLSTQKYPGSPPGSLSVPKNHTDIAQGPSSES